jgi:hypothetical protein
MGRSSVRRVRTFEMFCPNHRSSEPTRFRNSNFLKPYCLLPKSCIAPIGIQFDRVQRATVQLCFYRIRKKFGMQERTFC